MPSKKEKLPLSVTHPELAKEADGWDPATLTSGSNKKVLWHCSEGHNWEISPNSRTGSKKSGCPICSGLKTWKGHNDLFTLFPEIARQASNWDPTEFKPGSNKKVTWVCDLGHQWKAEIAKRAIRGDGCPVCSGRQTFAGFNDLETMDPKLASEANGWDPRSVTVSSRKKLEWKCKKGHKWVATVSDRSTGTDCPVCANKKLLTGFNDLLTTHPEIASEADGWDPSIILTVSGARVYWRCNLGHRWESSVRARSKSGLTCRVCSGLEVLAGYNDVATTHPNIAKEANGWNPTEMIAGTASKLHWKCELGHEWMARGYSRKLGSSCPICTGKQLLVGFNDLLTTHPEIASEADGWDPSTVTFGNGRFKKDWKCKKGHKYQSTVNNRTSDHACPVCIGRQVLAGFNDLNTTNPILAAQANGWDPTTLTQSSNKKMSWICEEGHEWTSDVANRTEGRGCPSCAISGFDPNSDGYLYFLNHSDWEMFQIGITNVPDDRISRHKRLGWELLELRGPMDGHLTQHWETAILRMLKARGADLSNSKIAGKFDGYSEAWSKSTFEVKSIKELMRLTEEFEG